MDFIQTLAQVLEEVPDYKVFKTVDELNESSTQLAEHYPDVVRRETVGKSRNGDDIEVLHIGSGSKHVLLFACPHPNEPIGAMMLDYLAEKLAADSSLRRAFDVTWHIIKTVDPDGTRLNEGWFKGPFTPTNYARNFYRPASYEQVEWTFPVQYKTLQFDDPLPETKSLMKVIDQVKPDFLYSLHNSGFGGAYFYISHPRPEVYEKLHQLVTSRGVPLHLGEPEMPFAVRFDQAIYRLPSITDTYDYFAENTDMDPAQIISGGASSFDYLSRVNEAAFSLVCEVPYFYDPRIEDKSPADVTRKEAVLQSIEISGEILTKISTILEQGQELVVEDSPFKKAASQLLAMSKNADAAKKRWAESAGLEQPATVAELFDNTTITLFYRLLILGMTVRMFATEIARRGPGFQELGQLTRLRDRAKAYFTDLSQKLESRLDYQVIPIRKLVQIQLGSALHFMQKFFMG